MLTLPMFNMAVHSSLGGAVATDQEEEEEEDAVFCACPAAADEEEEEEDDPFVDAVESISDLRRLAASNPFLLTSSTNSIVPSNARLKEIFGDAPSIRLDVTEDHGTKQKGLLSNSSSHTPSDTDSGVHDTSTGDAEEEEIHLPHRYSITITHSLLCDPDNPYCDDIKYSRDKCHIINEEEHTEGSDFKQTSRLRRGRQTENGLSPSQPEAPTAGRERTTEQRSEDLNTAIRWLRQEIIKMKQQDKALLRQFLELRATIHGMRCNGFRPRSCSSGSEFISNTGNASPLETKYDISHGGNKTGSLLRGEDVGVEFRPRTVSMLQPKQTYNLQTKTVYREYF